MPYKDKRLAYACVKRNLLRNIPKYTKIMHNLKINGCAICGYNEYDESLEFHHASIDKKKFNIDVTSMRFNEQNIINELNKCILLCSNCHCHITKVDRGGWHS